jgi:RHS repeat-associated protein
VTWSGEDSESGPRDYDVAYKVGSGNWVGWYTGTTRTQASFIGEKDQTYYFRVRATDNVSNTSAWVESAPVTIQTVRKNYHFGGQLVATRRGDEVYFIHGDHLGSTSLTTDNSGAVVAQTRYLPYGEERWTAGDAQPTDFTFTGQRAEGFGLMDYKARYYDPRLGRFISPDSIVPNPGSPQDLNRYSYVRGNPLRYHDPSGHQGGDPLNDFLKGLVYETTSNNLEAIFIPATSPWRQGAEALAVDKNDNVAFQLGRLTGSVGTVAQGCIEMEAGVAMMAGGGLEAGATAETVVGALPGVGVAVAGAGVAVHGGAVAARGMGGVFESSVNMFNAMGGGGHKGRVVNRSGKPYPKQRVRGYGEVPFPKGSIEPTNPGPMRAEFTQKMRMEYRDWWHDKYGWYPSPDKYEIHHIKPLSRGGTNDFQNLVPLRKGRQHNQFTNWWREYP